MQERPRVLVTGAGGFIGHHLVKYLVGHGYWVRGADIKEPEYEPTSAHEFEILDLRKSENCVRAMRDIDEVYGLAANMGGIGFIESNKAIIVRDNTLINLQSIEAGASFRSKALFVYLQRVRLSGLSSKADGLVAAKRRGCLSRGRRGWLRMGEAVHGAGMPALSGRLRVSRPES